MDGAGVTLWRCPTCGKAVKAEKPPGCHGPMKAVAVEAPPPVKKRCCLGRRSR